MVRADNLDPEGNVVTRAWFEGRCSRLRLDTHAIVDTLRTNPFGFLVTGPDRPLPAAYAPELCERLALYRRPPDAAHPAVRELAHAAATESDRDPARFRARAGGGVSGRNSSAKPARKAPRFRPPRQLPPAAARAATWRYCSSPAAGRWGSRRASRAATLTTRRRHRPSCTPGARYSCRAAAGAGTIPARDSPWRTGTSPSPPPPTPATPLPVTGTFRGDGVTASLTAEIAVGSIVEPRRAHSGWSCVFGRCDGNARRAAIISGCPACTFVLGGRSTVGHAALDRGIGVRIPASQPNFAKAKFDWGAGIQALRGSRRSRRESPHFGDGSRRLPRYSTANADIQALRGSRR